MPRTEENVMNDNRELVRQFLTDFNRHDFVAAARFMADDLVNHSALSTAQGRAGLGGIWEKLWEAFPDLTWTCEDMVAEGDRIVLRVRLRGTNSGPLRFARMPLPATGRTFDGEAIYIFRVAGGEIVELWSQRDELGLLRQLGHLTLAGGQS